MTPRSLGAVLFLAVTALTLHAQAPGPDPVRWLGFTPEAAYRDRGAPSEVFPLAVNDTLWQVVHFYPDHTYLFWTANRVWQVRLDRLWAGTLSGVTMGMPRADAEALLGEPTVRTDDQSLWNLPYQTFPRRLRLVFVEGLVADAYVYRSDL